MPPGPDPLAAFSELSGKGVARIFRRSFIAVAFSLAAIVVLPAPRCAFATETVIGSSCSGNQNGTDWDTVFQCVSGTFQRATPFLAGSVGIGTTSPGLKLDVEGGNTGYPIAIGGGAQTAGNLRLGNSTENLDFGWSGVSPWGFWIQGTLNTNTSAAPLLLNPNGGNVGIGTTGPTHTLDVTGTLNVTSVATAPTAAANTNTTQLATTAFVLTNGAAVLQQGTGSGNITNTSSYPTFLMSGATVGYTPVRTGKILVMAQFAVGGSGTPVFENVWGTGTAPHAGAAFTGTGFGALGSCGSCSGGQQTSLEGYVVLSVGTTYWFDIATTNIGGAAVSISNLQFVILEL